MFCDEPCFITQLFRLLPPSPKFISFLSEMFQIPHPTDVRQSKSRQLSSKPQLSSPLIKTAPVLRRNHNCPRRRSKLRQTITKTEVVITPNQNCVQFWLKQPIFSSLIKLTIVASNSGMRSSARSRTRRWCHSCWQRPIIVGRRRRRFLFISPTIAKMRGIKIQILVFFFTPV